MAKRDNTADLYVAPHTGRNHTDYYQLPGNDVILKDFHLAGGSLETLVDKHAKDSTMRKTLAIQILQQLSKDVDAIEKFNDILAAAEQAEALFAKSNLVRLSQRKSPGQVSALKAVSGFGSNSGQLTKRDPIDAHLDEIADEYQDDDENYEDDDE